MNNIEEWHRIIESEDLKGLEDILDKKVVFYSPVVFKAQEGRKLTATYLKAAYKMFFSNGNQSFTYVRELNTDNDSILEFTCEIEGVTVNGVDMIKWNEKGKIVEFKVMVRPFRAIELVKEKMLSLLQGMSGFDKMKLAVSSSIEKMF